MPPFIARLRKRLEGVLHARFWSRFSRRPPFDLVRLQRDTRVSREALRRFGCESDRAFTGLAQGIAGLNRRLSALRTRAEQLDLVLQDKDEDRALSAAYLLYKNALDLVHSCVGIAVAEQEQMNQIGRTLLKACGTRDTFQRNHLLLRMLTLNMRVEAVRLEPKHREIFLNIAAAIAEIDEKIVASTDAAFARIEAVIAEANSTHAQSKDLEHDLHRCAQASVDSIQCALASFKTALAPCAERSREIAELIVQTGPQTLAVIGSLQHQDIVRQQLEHVSAGFDDLCAHLQPDKSNLDRNAHNVEFGYVHHTATVQQAHLRASRIEIEKASSDVLGGLRALLELGEPLVEHFTALEQGACTAFSNCQVGPIFKNEIQKLVQIAEKSEAANDKSSRLVERIEDVVRVFSQEIASHELDVKLVALNAQIASAQTRTADALSRIAEETGLVADNNATLTKELTHDLRASLERLHDIKKNAVEFVAIANHEKRELERSVTEVGGRLAMLGTRVQTDSAGVRRDFETAYEENRALLDDFNFSGFIESCYAPAERLCERLLQATASSALDGRLSDAAVNKLAAHRQRYTMQKENLIHASTLGLAVDSTSVEPGEPELFIDDPLAGADPDLSTAAPDDSAQTDTGSPAENEVAFVAASTGGIPDENAPAAPPKPKPDFGDGIELF